MVEVKKKDCRLQKEEAVEFLGPSLLNSDPPYSTPRVVVVVPTKVLCTTLLGNYYGQAWQYIGSELIGGLIMSKRNRKKAGKQPNNKQPLGGICIYA
jgi:hypothetical protein